MLIARRFCSARLFDERPTPAWRILEFIAGVCSHCNHTKTIVPGKVAARGDRGGGGGDDDAEIQRCVVWENR